jgi:uncharacterized protein YndB with AHSA1/START domain
MTTTDSAADERELVITRLIDAPRETLWRCWTEPALLVQWFTPEPWKTVSAETDLRAGGASRIVMRGPAGEEFSNEGVYLDVVPNERLVFTDAYTAGWQPSEKPFFTAIITFADEGGGTRYTARARHWRVEDRDAHEKMGFHEGWNKAADQLEALARTL